VGTGGVGKTSLSAAIALAGAGAGRRAAVLTIDPARALGRALGMRALGAELERVVSTPGSLDVGMLEQASAWDAFIRRHAPSRAVEETILANTFYRQLSRRFSGSTEYVALEELCRLHESGRYDLIVLDTPPAAHALDFLRAPARVDRFLEAASASLSSRAQPLVARVLGRVERATGSETFHELAALLTSFQGLFAAVRLRSGESRALAAGDLTAFVLVVGPEANAIAGARELESQMTALGVRLKAIVQNRTHPLPAPLAAASETAPLEAELLARGAPPANLAWIRQAHRSYLAIASAEERHWQALRTSLPANVVSVRVPELGHDLHSLDDLAEVGRLLFTE
jgi:anion-transporting  ArsA/GET3 family ATPase